MESLGIRATWMVERAGAFSALKGEIRRVPSAPFTFMDRAGYPVEYAIADAVIIQKRPQAAKQALLICHMDTVYPQDHHFQDVVDGEVVGMGMKRDGAWLDVPSEITHYPFGKKPRHLRAIKVSVTIPKV